MSRGWRWWLAGALTLVSFLAVTWVVTRYLPRSLLQDSNGRLAVGIGAGAAVAALVALWGQTFGTAVRGEPKEADSVPAVPSVVSIAGGNSGIVSMGDRVRNTQRAAKVPDTARPEPGTSARATETSDASGAQIQIGGSNAGIASAGNDVTNIQEDC